MNLWFVTFDFIFEEFAIRLLLLFQKLFFETTCLIKLSFFLALDVTLEDSQDLYLSQRRVSIVEITEFIVANSALGSTKRAIIKVFYLHILHLRELTVRRIEEVLC